MESNDTELIGSGYLLKWSTRVTQNTKFSLIDVASSVVSPMILKLHHPCTLSHHISKYDKSGHTPKNSCITLMHDAVTNCNIGH